MARDEAFLQDIIEHPDDDAPRLIYADWLDDHGQPERAEFIRVQCELAQLPEGDSRREKLQAREQELLRAHGEEWDSNLRGLCDRLWYDRGFIGWAEFETASAFLRVADHLFALAPVRCLKIARPIARSGRWAACPHLCRVRRLELGGEDVHPRWAARSLALALSSPTLSGLTELSLLDNNLGPEAGRVLAASPNLNRLEILDLYGNLLGPPGMEALASAAHLCGLRRLDLSGNRIGDYGVRALAESRVLSGLYKLVLGTEANFGCTNDLGPGAIRHLTRSRRLTALRILDLHGNDVGDEGAALLAFWSGLSELADLDLSSTGLTDAGLEALAASPHATGLVRLGVAFNDELSDRGLGAVLDSPHLCRLAGLVVDDYNHAISKAMRRALARRFGEGLEVC